MWSIVMELSGRVFLRAAQRVVGMPVDVYVVPRHDCDGYCDAMSAMDD